MNEKLEVSINELSHYESLKRQDVEHRKLIKKLQLEIKALNKVQTSTIDSVSNRRELLIAFKDWYNPQNKNSGTDWIDIEEINEFLESNL